MQIGTEHEYSINDSGFKPLTISDRIIERVGGTLSDEVKFGGIKVSKELQKHAIELIPSRPGSLGFLEKNLYRGLINLYKALNYEYKFLGLGMHPMLTLDMTSYWDHDEQEYYRAYDRLFNIRQHGWLNIQALQINIPYEDPKKMVVMFNRIRSLIPYLVAVSASSPFVEGRMTSIMDNRLVYYRRNQVQIPSICNEILPERLSTLDEYASINRCIYSELRRRDADILCKEWVNSRGVIVRFSRKCLEVKAIDEQECLRSDMAISAFLLSMLRSELPLEEDEGALRAMLEEAIRNGTKNLRPELEKAYRAAYGSATYEERLYLPLVEKRIEQGSLAEAMAQEFKETGEIRPILDMMAWCLRENRPYSIDKAGC
jgi:hypothetical protein